MTLETHMQTRADPPPRAFGGEPTLSQGEKLIAYMLCDVMSDLDYASRGLANHVEKALTSGNDWALDWELRDMFHDHRHIFDEVRSVMDVLDMWVLLEDSAEALSSDDRQRLVNSAPHFAEVRCPGFDSTLDGNSYGIAFLFARNVERFRRFRDRKDFYLPHRATADHHRRMLEAYEPIKGPADGRTMTVEEMIPVLGAWMN